MYLGKCIIFLIIYEPYKHLFVPILFLLLSFFLNIKTFVWGFSNV